MLTEDQRTALAARLRRGQEGDAGEQRPARSRDVRTGVSPSCRCPSARSSSGFSTSSRPGEAYNIPQALRLSGPLDPAALDRALDALVARHEALRTRLVADGRGPQPVQVIDPPRPREPGADRTWPDAEPEKRQVMLRELIDAAAMRSFSLAEGPLLRAGLVRLGQPPVANTAEHVLMVVVHHAVFDGWSSGVLVSELAALYRAEVTGEPSALPGLPVQFADYAVWERDRLQGQALADLEDYWRTTMDGFETVQFPTDRPRPVLDSFDGGAG